MTQYTGTPGLDTLTGSAGNDFLDGGAGADSLSGLAGDDVYQVDDPADLVIELPGEGTDRINALISFTLPAHVEDLWLVGSADTNGTGNGVGNTLWGNAGLNTLSGLGGDDYLDGGAGADTLIGGSGNDQYWVDDAGDLVVEQPGEGNDTVNAAISYTLPANVENLVLKPGAGNLAGHGNGLDNQLTGNEGQNTLDGGAGNDTLDGGSGADTMIGGPGNDSYRIDDAGDLVVESPGEGTDTVTSALPAYTLPADVENLTLGPTYASTGNLAGTGNGQDNTLRGNSGANALDGAGGDDTLIGGDGNDTLTGGSGHDSFVVSTGDSGTDTITDFATGDVLQVWGANFTSSGASSGDGATVLAGELQVATGGGQTTLSIGLDANPGADVQIVLAGSYAAANFQLSGFEIRYDPNHAPTLDASLPAQQASAGQAFSYQLPAAAFSDADGDTLSYSGALFDIDWGIVPLPAWLQFDAATRRFSGTPAAGDVGDLMLLVTADDGNGGSASGLIDLHVAAAGTPGTPGPAPTPSDTTPPGASLSDDCSGTATGTLHYGVVPVTGLASDDFLVSGGHVTALSGSGASYSLTVEPDAQAEGTLSLSLKAGAVTDAAGNPNLATTAEAQAIDTRAPRLLDFAPGQAAHGIATDSPLVFTFAEPLQRGIGVLQLKDAANQTVASFDAASSVHLAISGSTLTLMPGTGVLQPGSSYTLVLPGGAVRDLAGNDGGGGAYGFATAEQPNQAPTGGLAIVGRPEQGQTLTVQSTLADADGLGPLHYQWLANGSALAGATGTQLLLTQALVGQAISVQVRYTDGRQHDEMASATATATVANVNDAPVAQPLSAQGAEDAAAITLQPRASDADPGDSLHFSIAGGPSHGQLSFDAASGLFVYRPDANFNGSDSFSYRATDASGASSTASATITLTAVNDAPDGHVHLLGIAHTGQTLRADALLADADGLGTLHYQWQAGGHDIAGATASQYTLAQADAGQPIRVLVRYTDGGGTAEQVASDAVTASADAQLVGSSGVDTATIGVPPASLTSYRFDNGVLTITTTGTGAQTFTGIERVQFDHQLYALDTQAPTAGSAGGHAWQAAALWHAAFGHLPDTAALSQWTAAADHCATMGELAQRMIDHYAPGIDTASLVAFLYQQLVHQAPSAAQVQAFADQVGPGHTFATQGDLFAYAAQLALNTVELSGFSSSPQLLDGAWF